MKKLLVLFCFLASFCFGQSADDNIVVVGNQAQPVQWTHQNSIQNALMRAGQNGVVWIPPNYRGTDCSPISICNPGNTVVIDLRGGAFQTYPPPSGGGNFSTPSLVPLVFVAATDPNLLLSSDPNACSLTPALTFGMVCNWGVGNGVLAWVTAFGVQEVLTVCPNPTQVWTDGQIYGFNASLGCFYPVPNVSFNSSTGVVAGPNQLLLGSLTTTASTSDTVTLAGMTSSGHCAEPAATNSGAAGGIASVYISNKTTNQITVTHTATAGWTFDILCTSH